MQEIPVSEQSLAKRAGDFLNNHPDACRSLYITGIILVFLATIGKVFIEINKEREKKLPEPPAAKQPDNLPVLPRPNLHNNEGHPDGHFKQALPPNTMNNPDEYFFVPDDKRLIGFYAKFLRIE